MSGYPYALRTSGDLPVAEISTLTKEALLSFYNFDKPVLQWESLIDTIEELLEDKPLDGRLSTEFNIKFLNNVYVPEIIRTHAGQFNNFSSRQYSLKEVIASTIVFVRSATKRKKAYRTKNELPVRHARRRVPDNNANQTSINTDTAQPPATSGDRAVPRPSISDYRGIKHIMVTDEKAFTLKLMAVMSIHEVTKDLCPNILDIRKIYARMEARIQGTQARTNGFLWKYPHTDFFALIKGQEALDMVHQQAKEARLTDLELSVYYPVSDNSPATQNIVTNVAEPVLVNGSEQPHPKQVIPRKRAISISSDSTSSSSSSDEEGGLAGLARLQAEIKHRGEQTRLKAELQQRESQRRLAAQSIPNKTTNPVTTYAGNTFKATTFGSSITKSNTVGLSSQVESQQSTTNARSQTNAISKTNAVARTNAIPERTFQHSQSMGTGPKHLPTSSQESASFFKIPRSGSKDNYRDPLTGLSHSVDLPVHVPRSHFQNTRHSHGYRDTNIPSYKSARPSDRTPRINDYNLSDAGKQDRKTSISHRQQMSGSNGSFRDERGPSRLTDRPQHKLQIVCHRDSYPSNDYRFEARDSWSSTMTQQDLSYINRHGFSRYPPASSASNGLSIGSRRTSQLDHLGNLHSVAHKALQNNKSEASVDRGRQDNSKSKNDAKAFTCPSSSTATKSTTKISNKSPEQAAPDDRPRKKRAKRCQSKRHAKQSETSQQTASRAPAAPERTTQKLAGVEMKRGSKMPSFDADHDPRSPFFQGRAVKANRERKDSTMADKTNQINIHPDRLRQQEDYLKRLKL